MDRAEDRRLAVVLLVDEDAILRPGQRALDKQLVAVTGAFLVNEKRPRQPARGLPGGVFRLANLEY